MSATYHLLLVDDEPNILKSLKRLFRELEDTHVFTADSAKAASEIFKQHRIDLLISDEKMPHVEGHRFVQWVKKNYPDTLRIILTGFADMDAMRQAVNRGEVYRYLFKPWDDNELMVIVKNALSHAKVTRERDELTAHLAEMVEQQTAELNRALDYIRSKQQATEESLSNVFSFLDSIVAMVNRETGGQTLSSRIAEMAARLAEAVSDDPSTARDARMVAFFFPIGALSLGRSLEDQLREGSIGSEILEASRHLVNATFELHNLAEAIGHLDEHWDGSGVPDNLSGEDIPLVSRIVRLAMDYVVRAELRELDSAIVATELKRKAGTIYDPSLTDTLLKTIRANERRAPRTLTVRQLVPGMVLADDLRLDNGMTFITAGSTLSREMIASIRTRVETPHFPLSDESTASIRPSEG